MSKEKLPNEIIDFQPDALEIKNSRLPLPIRICVWMPFVPMILAIFWACWAEVDVVVQGSGKLVTDLPTIVMKPLERSVIKKVNVKIGDVVKKGDIMIIFDPEINQSEAERLTNEKEALSAQFARLKAEFLHKPYTGGSKQFEKWQLAIYKQRVTYYTERMKYFQEALSQIETLRKSKEVALKSQKERVAEMEKLYNMFWELYHKQAASLKERIQITISYIEMKSAVDQLEHELLEIKHRKGTTEAERNSFIQEWRNSIAENMVTVERNLTAATKEYAKVKNLIEYVYLRAPCDAVVHEIASFSPGSAVREAEALITLIPLGEEMELEAEIRPQDIGKVATGASARVKLSAFPFQKHGTLKGTVRNISENTLQKEGPGQALPYYRVRLKVEGKLEKVKENFRLIPGMEAQCEIKCGRRRVIEFVIYPLIKALDETAREP